MTTALPETVAEFQEALRDEKKIAALLNAGEFNSFVNGYANKLAESKVGKDLDGQIRDQVDAVFTEFAKNNRPKGATKLDLRWNGTPPALGTGGVRNAAYNPKVPTAQLDGLYDLGELAIDVQQHRLGRNLRNPDAFAKVQEVTNSYSETDPSTGGFLVPEETRSELLQIALEQSIVRSRATVITMSSLTTKIPFVDETTHSGSVFGGMVFYWIGESASITPSEARFGNVKLEANKLVGGARVPNELWNDASALSTWLQTNAPRGLAFFEDNAFINGPGAGQPLGFRKGGAKIQAARAGANAITIDDISGMYARMLPSSLGSAVWLVNQTLLPKLFSLSTGTGGYPLGVVNISDNPMPTILGRPMIVTEKVPALGSADDIMFVDLAYYLVGDRQAISLDFSEHSRFMNDEVELRLIERVDGQPWVQTALTPLNGDTLSPFVGIDAS